MDQIATQLIATSPIAAVILILGAQAIGAWSKHMTEMRECNTEIIQRLKSVERRMLIVNPDGIPK